MGSNLLKVLMQPEDQIKVRDESYCTQCRNLLMPVWENNGFEAPDPSHWEIVGYEKCECV